MKVKRPNNIKSHLIDYTIPVDYGVGKRVLIDDIIFYSDNKISCQTVIEEKYRYVFLRTIDWSNKYMFHNTHHAYTHLTAILEYHQLALKVKKTGEIIYYSDENLPDYVRGGQIQVSHKLNKSDFEDDPELLEEGFKIGDYSTKFVDLDYAKKIAKKEFKRIFEKGWKLKL